MTETTGWPAAVRGTVVAELGYRTAAGPEATSVVPHVLDDVPLLALTYARRELAETLDRAGEAVLVCSDGRLPLRGWQPVALRGRVEVVPDPDGDTFESALLDDELRKYPPARLLADSLMQRREHWWYLPRLLVRLGGPVVLDEIAGRDEPEQAVCFVEGADGLAADTVALRTSSGGDPRDAEPGGTLDVRSLGGRALPSGRGVLLWQDFSPDLERRSQLMMGGRLDGGRFVVDDRSGRARLPEPANVWRRWVEHRRFERSCRRGLRGPAYPPM